MKHVIKAALCALMVFAGYHVANAQKLGYINTAEVFGAMPERDSASQQLEAYAREQSEILEIMEVEYNTQREEMNKNLSTWTAAMAQTKQEALQSLVMRIQEKEQQVQQDLQNKQNKLMAPLIEKINAAITKAAQAAGVTAVFDVNTLTYFDPAAMTDMAPMVKKELGIQ